MELVQHKPGRVNGKNSAYRSGGTHLPNDLKQQINRIVYANRDKAASRDKKVSNATQEKRHKEILGFFSDLYGLGYKLQDAMNLKEKHILAVAKHLEEKGQSPSTIQNKLSKMRIFCGWIGKRGMVRDSHLYVENAMSARRSAIAREDKSWDGKGIDLEDKLPEVKRVDEYVAIKLELCLAFGLRVKEAVMLRPAVNHIKKEGAEYIWLREGTKGDRPRVVPIENEMQRDVIERAKALADKKTGFLGGRGKTLEQKLSRFYNVMRKCGITLAESNVTAHGLRHQFMHEEFRNELGIEPPVRGGDMSSVDKDKLHLVKQRAMEKAGHTRIDIGASYYGSTSTRK